MASNMLILVRWQRILAPDSLLFAPLLPMADIFISYSSKDRAQAEQLTELLDSAGPSCWIDKSGIHGAEQWATEIVEGIRGMHHVHHPTFAE